MMTGLGELALYPDRPIEDSVVDWNTLERQGSASSCLLVGSMVASAAQDLEIYDGAGRLDGVVANGQLADAFVGGSRTRVYQGGTRKAVVFLGLRGSKSRFLLGRDTAWRRGGRGSTSRQRRAAIHGHEEAGFWAHGAAGPQNRFLLGRDTAWRRGGRGSTSRQRRAAIHGHGEAGFLGPMGAAHRAAYTTAGHSPAAQWGQCRRGLLGDHFDARSVSRNCSKR